MLSREPVPWVKPHSIGGLDCNGFSPIQRTVASAKACTDIRGIRGIDNKNTWGARPSPRVSTRGDGSSLSEMQFYPPGLAPFVDNISCDNTHWCASLHINELECTANFASCNTGCEETTNFAFIQTNGVPTGPPVRSSAMSPRAPRTSTRCS